MSSRRTLQVSSLQATYLCLILVLADRGARDGPPREDLPMPTAPPYTAFIGNLAFDLTEMELEDFFASSKVCGLLVSMTLLV